MMRQATNNKQTVKATAARELMSKLKDLGTLRVVADRAVQEGCVTPTVLTSMIPQCSPNIPRTFPEC